MLDHPLVRTFDRVSEWPLCLMCSAGPTRDALVGGLWEAWFKLFAHGDGTAGAANSSMGDLLLQTDVQEKEDLPPESAGGRLDIGRRRPSPSKLLPMNLALQDFFATAKSSYFEANLYELLDPITAVCSAYKPALENEYLADLRGALIEPSEAAQTRALTALMQKYKPQFRVGCQGTRLFGCSGWPHAKGKKENNWLCSICLRKYATLPPGKRPLIPDPPRRPIDLHRQVQHVFRCIAKPGVLFGDKSSIASTPMDQLFRISPAHAAPTSLSSPRPDEVSGTREGKTHESVYHDIAGDGLALFSAASADTSDAPETDLAPPLAPPPAPLLVAAPYSLASEGKREPRLRIGVFDARGCSTTNQMLDCINAYRERYGFFEAERVKGVDVGKTSTDLSRFHAILFPGGPHFPMLEDLGKAGQDKIREFVRGGGGYIGCCGGAYLAERLGIAAVLNLGGNIGSMGIHGPGYMCPIDESPDHGCLMQEMLGRDAVAAVGLRSGRDGEVVLDNPPLILPCPTASRENGGLGLPQVEAVSITSYDVAKGFCMRNNLRETMPSLYREYVPGFGRSPGTVAAVATLYGRGRVLLFAGHPENSSPVKAAAAGVPGAGFDKRRMIARGASRTATVWRVAKYRGPRSWPRSSAVAAN